MLFTSHQHIHSAQYVDILNALPYERDACTNIECKLTDAQLHETTRVEEVEARRCKARLEHLVAVGLPQKDEATKWADARMDRVLADYMLRRGYQRSAAQLARERDMEVRSLRLAAALQLH